MWLAARLFIQRLAAEPWPGAGPHDHQVRSPQCGGHGRDTHLWVQVSRAGAPFVASLPVVSAPMDRGVDPLGQADRSPHDFLANDEGELPSGIGAGCRFKRDISPANTAICGTRFLK